MSRWKVRIAETLSVPSALFAAACVVALIHVGLAAWLLTNPFPGSNEGRDAGHWRWVFVSAFAALTLLSLAMERRSIDRDKFAVRAIWHALMVLSAFVFLASVLHWPLPTPAWTLIERNLGGSSALTRAPSAAIPGDVRSVSAPIVVVAPSSAGSSASGETHGGAGPSRGDPDRTQQPTGGEPWGLLSLVVAVLALAVGIATAVVVSVAKEAQGRVLELKVMMKEEAKAKRVLERLAWADMRLEIQAMHDDFDAAQGYAERSCLKLWRGALAACTSAALEHGSAVGLAEKLEAYNLQLEVFRNRPNLDRRVIALVHLEISAHLKELHSVLLDGPLVRTQDGQRCLQAVGQLCEAARR
jgi:hypothetical protein